MKRNNIYKNRLKLKCLTFSLFSTVLLFGCATTQEQKIIEPPDNYQAQIDQLKINNQASIRLSQQVRLEIDAINLRLIAVESEIVSLQNTLSSFPMDKAESLQNKITIMNEELRDLTLLVENKLKVPTFKPKKIKSNVSKDAPKEYNNAMIAFESKKYQEAIIEFQNAIKLNPTSSFLDDSYYWLGLSYFRLADYGLAIKSFQKVFTFAHTDKGDSALFGVAQSYLKLGNQQRAGNEFKKIEVLYPQSEYIPKAKIELNKLNVE